MSRSLSPLPPHACQADSACRRPPRFQAQLEAADGTQRIRKNAEACADHLGDMVQALTAWARVRHLTDGQLTVLAIDPPLDNPPSRSRVDQDGPAMVSLAFGAIRLTSE